ncbi:MAG TPA: asparagine synthase-related protein, partial [Candidatus Deferrimicrobium sp.]|nr:asparagine synthase-related protein [Candidatus Deferrimicrobium sp.]
MGFIAGICSRDGSDIASFLYKMAMKLRHRGNSPFCVCIKKEDGWESVNCEKPEEILTYKIPFGIVGRHLIIDPEKEWIPYSDCQNERLLLMDGRIYNVAHVKQSLGLSHKGILENPSVVLHLFEELQKKVFDFSKIFEKFFNLIEGMFAAALILKEHVFVFRDLIGIKPLYLYLGSKYVAFASEKKALWGAGFKERIKPLRPGRVVRVAEKGFTSHFQMEFTSSNLTMNQLGYYRDRLLQLLENNLIKLKPADSFYLLFSGGIDSTLLAALLQKRNIGFNTLVIGSEKSKDIQSAQRAAELIGMPLETLEFDVSTLEQLFPLLIYHIESRDEKKLNIAFPLFYGSSYLHPKQIKVLYSGQGADELFGGY